MQGVKFMKVISGKYKGRVLDGFDIVGTRPTMDRVKESLFAMIQGYLDEAVVLDLFSGSGNLGIEALSEGAKICYFVDKNKKASQIIKRNLDKILCDDYFLFSLDYQEALRKFSLESLKFDLIFLDPPYQTDFVAKSILLIDKYQLLTHDGIIVCESDTEEKITYPNNFIVVKKKKYGDKWVVILKQV